MTVVSARMGAELSARETEVLEGIARGLTNDAIGRELNVSGDTVKMYARRMFRKLGADSRAHAVAIGMRAGIIE